jgi:hypothetical protein
MANAEIAYADVANLAFGAQLAHCAKRVGKRRGTL